MMPLKVHQPPFVRQPIAPPHARARPQPGTAVDFDALVRGTLSPSQASVSFSAHAQARLRERNIHLDPQALQRLTEAIDKVQAKGSRESLILMKDLAFVVNVKNRNVITALDGAHMRERVFTNIDSTIIVD